MKRAPRNEEMGWLGGFMTLDPLAAFRSAIESMHSTILFCEKGTA